MSLLFGVTSGGVLVPLLLESDGSLPQVGKGWIGAAWQKNPLQFGFSGPVFETASNTDLPGTDHIIYTTAVPAGEIRIFTQIAFVYIGTSPTRVWVSYYGNSSLYHIYNVLSPTTYQMYDRQGWFVLEEGDQLACVVEGPTAGDDIYLHVSGFRVDIDQ